MLQSTQQIIGQLWGGLASCDLPDEPDYFGRFDVSFPMLKSYIAPSAGPDDIDGSGVVDATDVQLVINAVLNGKTSGYNADVNNSGKVDAVDIQLVILAALSNSG